MKEILREFQRIPVASISDALDKLGIRGFMSSEIKPVLKGVKVVGPAVTVAYVPAKKALPPKHAIEAIDAAKPEDVLVLAAIGEKDVAFWGGLMTTASKVKGLAGVVIDGGTRDLKEIEELNFPVFARSIVPSTSVGRYETVGYNLRVSCGNVYVDPGDIIVGDSDGIVVIPEGSIQEVLKMAREMDEREAAETADLKKGMSLGDVIKKYARI